MRRDVVASPADMKRRCSRGRTQGLELVGDLSERRRNIGHISVEGGGVLYHTRFRGVGSPIRHIYDQ